MRGISRSSTIEEVAAIVSEALRAHGISAVLTGGAVVSLYSDNEYQSWDLDFIVEGLAKKVDPVMDGLGFRRERGRYFVHPQSDFFVEFPAGPLAIGEKAVKKVTERKTKHGIIRLLPPTECVMDRLAAYYHWNDPQGLDQAVAVATRHPVSLDKIKRWSAEEGMQEKWTDFTAALKRPGSNFRRRK